MFHTENARLLDRPTCAQTHCNYAPEVENLDRLFRQILNAVARARELDATVACVASDHGEMLGDHGDAAMGGERARPAHLRRAGHPPKPHRDAARRHDGFGRHLHGPRLRDARPRNHCVAARPSGGPGPAGRLLPTARQLGPRQLADGCAGAERDAVQVHLLPWAVPRESVHGAAAEAESTSSRTRTTCGTSSRSAFDALRPLLPEGYAKGCRGLGRRLMPQHQDSAICAVHPGREMGDEWLLGLMHQCIN